MATPGPGVALLCRPTPRLLALTLLLGLAISLAPVSVNAAPDRSASTHSPASQTHLSRADEPGPIHAGNTFGWWRSLVWREEFHERTPRGWTAAGAGTVRNQNGMLTLNATGPGSLSATLTRPGVTTGRWETRLRSRRYGTSAGHFRVVTELVPTRAADQRCGGQNISLVKYRIGDSQPRFYANSLPARSFRATAPRRDLGLDKWHTYAVEVTPRRISWFVDAKVIATLRRPDAISGVPLQIRFTMEAPDTARPMNPSRMQMDWLRHWSTRTPNSKPVAAPAPRLATNPNAC